MKKRIIFFSIAIAVAIGLIVLAILQMMPDTEQTDEPNETEPATELSENDTQNPDETECSHVISETFTTENGKHFRICTAYGCDYVQDEEYCHGGTADCMQHARCIVCGAEYGELASHSWSAEWTSVDSESHTHVCTTTGCSAVSETQAHDFSAETDESPVKICTLCGYEIAPEIHTHTLSAVAEVNPSCTSEGRAPHYICSICSKIFADPEGAQEGMRAAAPAARKPTCLRRPVIRADVEFGMSGSLRSEGKDQCESPRIQCDLAGACRTSVSFDPSA